MANLIARIAVLLVLAAAGAKELLWRRSEKKKK